MNNLHGTYPSKTLHIFNYSCDVKRKIMHTHLRAHITDLVGFFVIKFWFGMRPSRKILNYITTFIFDLYK